MAAESTAIGFYTDFSSMGKLWWPALRSWVAGKTDDAATTDVAGRDDAPSKADDESHAVQRRSDPPEVVGSGQLIICGSTHGLNESIDSDQVIAAFGFIKTVCSVQMGEDYTQGSFLPDSCRTSPCARAVDLVNASCASSFLAPGFSRAAFWPLFSPVASKCSLHSRATTPTVRITDPIRHLNPVTALNSGCRGQLTDGMGRDGYKASVSGQDIVVLQAAPGEEVTLVITTQYLPPGDSVRLYATGKVVGQGLMTLTGTDLPMQGGRAYHSIGGKMAVRAITMSEASGVPSWFSFDYTLSSNATDCPPPPPPPPPPAFCKNCLCLFGCESAGSFSNDEWCDAPWTGVAGSDPDLTGSMGTRENVAGHPVTCAGTLWRTKEQCVSGCWGREFGYAACVGPWFPPGSSEWSSPTWTPCGAPPPAACGEPHSKNAGCHCCSECQTYCPGHSSNCHGSGDPKLACCASSCGLGCLSCDYYCDPSC